MLVQANQSKQAAQRPATYGTRCQRGADQDYGLGSQALGLEPWWGI